MKKHQRYEYEWTDCQSEDSWTLSTEIDELIDKKTSRLFKNVGYFVKERNNFCVFAAGYSPRPNADGVHYFHLTFIPKRMVLKTKKI